MDYIVRYRAIRDDKIMCEVVALDPQRRPTGPIAVKGTGYSKKDAHAAARAAATDAAVQAVLDANPA